MSLFKDKPFPWMGLMDEILKFRKYFLSTYAIILIFGVIMVFSASYIFAGETYGSPTYFILRQLIFIGVGVVASLIIGNTKLTFWLKYSYHIGLFFLLLLFLTFIPGVGLNVKGAHRWISAGFFSIQPGEFVKFSTLLLSIYFFENFAKLDVLERTKYAISLFLPLLLLLFQPDFGSFSICFVLLVFVCFMSSFPRKYFYGIAVSAFVSMSFIMILEPYRVRRLLAFLDPWKNPKTSGFQIIQSYLAFANGGVFGLGLGNSNEKLFYLPEAHNDFIFSVIGEELGLFGVVAVVALFMALIYFGLRLSLALRTKSASLTVSSIVFALGLQVFVNMAVVLGLLPTKGLNLPLISYGGSSILANFMALGIIFSSIKQSEELVVGGREYLDSQNKRQATSHFSSKIGHISNF